VTTYNNTSVARAKAVLSQYRTLLRSDGVLTPQVQECMVDQDKSKPAKNMSPEGKEITTMN
jgi:hypothetical protein